MLRISNLVLVSLNAPSGRYVRPAQDRCAECSRREQWREQSAMRPLPAKASQWTQREEDLA